MKTQELRIGNLIKEGVIFDIGHIDGRFGVHVIEGMFDSFTKGYLLDDIHPLEITPELLEKAGFIKRGIYYHFPDNDIFKLEQYKNKNAFWLRHGRESIDCVRINYYHQLQNLYFALTGKEIGI